MMFILLMRKSKSLSKREYKHLPDRTPRGDEFYKKFRMNGYEIIQRISDNYINVTYLDYQINLLRVKNSTLKRASYFVYLLGNRGHNFILALYVKGLLDDNTPPYTNVDGVRGNNTWMHPFVFMDYFYSISAANAISLLWLLINEDQK